MKRRGFLKLLGLAPTVAVPSVVSSEFINSEPKYTMVEPIVHGNVGVQEIDVQGVEFRVFVETPKVMTNEEGQYYGTEQWQTDWSKCPPTGAVVNPSVVVPVYENSTVTVVTRMGDRLTFKPEWQEEKSRFRPVQYIGNIVTIGSINNNGIVK